MLETQQVVAFSTIKSRSTAPLCGQKLTWQSKVPEVASSIPINGWKKKVLLQKISVFQRSDLLLGRLPRLFTISAPAGSTLKTFWRWTTTTDNSQSELAWLALFWPFMLENGLFFSSAPGPASEDDAAELNHDKRMKPSEVFATSFSSFPQRQTVSYRTFTCPSSHQFSWEQQQAPLRDLFHLPAWTPTLLVCPNISGDGAQENSDGVRLEPGLWKNKSSSLSCLSRGVGDI